MSPSLARSPLPDDQIAVVRRLLSGATAEQRQWLSGYVAGFQAAADPRTAPAAPQAAKPPLTILYASESGNAETLAAQARKAAARAGFSVKVVDMADTAPAHIARAGTLLLIASTWGEGDPPQRAEAFHAALMAPDAPRLDGLRYATLALGDRAYARFCETGRQFDARLAALGAKRIADLVECDLEFKKPAAGWIEASLRTLAEQANSRGEADQANPRGEADQPNPRGEQADPGAAVIRVDFARAAPAETGVESAADAEASDEARRLVNAEITAQINLNSSRSDIETYHVELSLTGSGLTYRPGDAIGFVPRNDPALVDAVLTASGLTDDAALPAALGHQLDITTLTRAQLAEYARLTGDAALRTTAEDDASAAEFLRDRQFIDLLEAAPHRLTAQQLTDLLRPLPPRLYSVASSQAVVGEEAHLLFAKVEWESHGRARRGVASGDVAMRRRVGDAVPLYVKPNPHFRLPTDATAPVIMIGPGTGVAPFRAFAQEREAIGASGRAWLFFGARRFTHDFLYQLEWQDWLKSGVLSRIDLAFSRDQRDKIYVQHRMWEQRHELYAWLRDGAFVYVCGDVKAMAKDVHAMLLAIIADQSGCDTEAAAAELRDIQRAGRYRRDVY